MKTLTQDIEQGRGGLKYYNYWSANIRFRTKALIKEGLELGITMMRTDKITGQVEKFNYKTNSFEKVKKGGQ